MGGGDQNQSPFLCEQNCNVYLHLVPFRTIFFKIFLGKHDPDLFSAAPASHVSNSD